MPVRKINTVTERAGVNYVCAVVEAANSVFKEINRQHDYGHDAFVLLVEGEQVSSKEIALQIKSGASYCTPTECRIPATHGQLAFWAGHGLVTLGVVHDPAEDMAYWVDLQEEARQRMRHAKSEGAVIVFPKATWNRFDRRMFTSFLVPMLQGKTPHLDLPTALMWARSEDYATHALGVRVLVARHRGDEETWSTILDLFATRSPEETSSNVCVALVKMMGHPDAGFFSDEVPQPLRAEMQARILRFGSQECAKLLAHVDDNGFERGGMGNGLLTIFASLDEGPEIIVTIRDSTEFKQSIRDHAALLYAIYSDDPQGWRLWGIRRVPRGQV